jgi:hypothetical protein
MRRSLTALLIFAAALAGCGGSDHEQVDPELMLDQATTRGIPNASLEIDARLQVIGVDRLSEPLRLRLDGPYLSNGSARVPSFDWRLSASALGFPVGGRVLSTGSNVYLSLYGNDYEVGSGSVAAANQRIEQAAEATGSRPDRGARSWFGQARVVGDDNAGGEDCERIEAPLRRDQTAGDLAPIASALGLSQPPAVSGKATACVGYDDRRFHELEIDAVIDLPAADRSQLGGATGARLNADLVISEIGEQEPISAPGGSYRPIQDLLLTLNDLGVPIPL